MKRKALSILLVAAMTATMVMGCGTGKGSSSNGGTQAEKFTRLQREMKTNYMVLG